MNVNHLQMNSSFAKSNSNILTTPLFHIITFDRENYSDIRNTKEIQENGIYILYNHETHYIGQNSSQKGIINRLDSHLKEKDWWTKGLFFAPKDGFFINTFTKAHYDYIETTLIQRFLQKDISIQNKTIGNTSPISQEDKAICEAFMAQIIIALKNIFNLDLFQLYYVSYLENLVNQLLDNTLDKEK